MVNASSISRRDFLARGAALVASVRGWSPAEPLRIGIVATENASSSFQRGALLGLEEARHALALFNGTIETEEIRVDSPDLGRFTGIVGAGSTDETAAAARAGALYINAASASDALRVHCLPNVFHVAPSDAMYRDALSQAGGSGARAVAWHASLQRFGADTLNRRYEARFASPMDAHAWGAWLATKILAEVWLRTRSGRVDALANHLRQASTKFDGHKGRPLSFRAWDHQLRQPLYVLRGEDERVVAELPASSGDEDDPRVALDRLGAGPTQHACAR